MGCYENTSRWFTNACHRSFSTHAGRHALEKRIEAVASESDRRLKTFESSQTSHLSAFEQQQHRQESRLLSVVDEKIQRVAYETQQQFEVRSADMYARVNCAIEGIMFCKKKMVQLGMAQQTLGVQ